MKAYLALEDGTVFEGKSAGAEGTVFGEIVFNTSMTGYQEILTDPSNYGHIVTMTYPLVGNYGVNEQDSESNNVWAKGFVVRELCKNPSNWRMTETLQEFLLKNNIVTIEGLDTREITKIIRENGSMNCMITTDVDFKVEDYINKIKSYTIKDAVKNVTCQEIYIFKNKNGKYKVAMLDLGLTRSILENISDAGCEITVIPAKTSVDEIAKGNFDGIVLSNGSGSPKECTDIIENVRSLQNFQIPIFGIGLGHQLIALANGLEVEKMTHGHRGSNYPVTDVKNNRTFITSQNHGYVVSRNKISDTEVKITHKNLNDNTIEGLKYKNYPVLTVQFHPKSSKGVLDTGLIQDFIKLMEVRKNA